MVFRGLSKRFRVRGDGWCFLNTAVSLSKQRFWFAAVLAETHRWKQRVRSSQLRVLVDLAPQFLCVCLCALAFFSSNVCTRDSLTRLPFGHLDYLLFLNS